jgi:hypothetical protein
MKTFLTTLVLFSSIGCAQPKIGAKAWKSHVIHAGHRTPSAVAADFTGDGRKDVITSSGGKVRLFIGPDWKQVTLHEHQKKNWACIHSEVMDVDGDGDADWIGADRTRVIWLEQPQDGARGNWKLHVLDDKLRGIHCVLAADVNRDGRIDLLANSFSAQGDVPNSIAWLQSAPNAAKGLWKRHALADKDAPGGNHYMGFGDINGDGRPDVTCGAKGAPFKGGNWFAYWLQPKDPTQPWAKTVVSENQVGATNLLPADLNGDGKIDLFASRGHGEGVLWFEGPKWTPHEIDPKIPGPHCLLLADLDGDGDLDGATCGKIKGPVTWYENNGKGNFTVRRIGSDHGAYDIRAIDLDDDGDLDLLIGGHGSAKVIWYANPLK